MVGDILYQTLDGQSYYRYNLSIFMLNVGNDYSRYNKRKETVVVVCGVVTVSNTRHASMP